MADLSKIVDELSTLTVLEAADLAKMLEEKWGVTAAAAAPGAAATATAAAADTPHFSSSILARSAASRTVRLLSSSTSFERSAMTDKSFFGSNQTRFACEGRHAASSFLA